MSLPKSPTRRSIGSTSANRTGKQEPAKDPAGPAGWPPRRMWLVFLLVLAANFIVTSFFAPGAEAPITVPYTVFKQEVIKDNVESIYSRGEVLEGRFAKAVTYPQPNSEGEATRCQRFGARRAAHRHRIQDHAARVRRPGTRGTADQP